MQPAPSTFRADEPATDATTAKPTAILPDTLTLASAAARIGQAMVDASRMAPARRAAFLRTIANEIRLLGSHTEALAAHLDPIDDPKIVVICRHCRHEQPTPIDWSTPCPACGGER